MDRSLSHSWFDPPDDLSRKQEFYSESRRERPKIPLIECDQGISPAIDSRFEHHLIGGIAKLGPPEKTRLYRLGQSDDRSQKHIELGAGKARRQLVLGAPADRFIFHRQSYRCEQAHLILAGRSQYRS